MYCVIMMSFEVERISKDKIYTQLVVQSIHHQFFHGFAGIFKFLCR